MIELKFTKEYSVQMLDGAKAYIFEPTKDTCFSFLKITITQNLVFLDIETKKNNSLKITNLESSLKLASVFAQNYLGTMSTLGIRPEELDEKITKILKALAETENDEIDLKSVRDLYTKCQFKIPADLDKQIKKQEEQQVEKSKQEAQNLIKFKQAEKKYVEFRKASDTLKSTLHNTNNNDSAEWQLAKIEDYIPLFKPVGVSCIFESKALPFQSIKINLEADHQEFSMEIGIAPENVSYHDSYFATFTDHCWNKIAEHPHYSMSYMQKAHVLRLSNFPLSLLETKLNATLDEISKLQTISEESRKLIMDTVTSIVTNANDETAEVSPGTVCAM